MQMDFMKFVTIQNQVKFCKSDVKSLLFLRMIYKFYLARYPHEREIAVFAISANGGLNSY